MRNRKVKKMVLSHYDTVYMSIKHIAKSFSVERVPLNMVDEVLDKAIFKKEQLTESKVSSILSQVNDTIITLREVIKKQSKIIGDDKISLRELKQMTDALKQGFLSGYNEQK